MNLTENRSSTAVRYLEYTACRWHALCTRLDTDGLRGRGRDRLRDDERCDSLPAKGYDGRHRIGVDVMLPVGVLSLVLYNRESTER